MGGWTRLNAGAMSARISRTRDRLLLTIPPRRFFFICGGVYCVGEMGRTPGSDGMICIFRPTCIFRTWNNRDMVWSQGMSTPGFGSEAALL
jgi:hypothetical protein